MKKFLMFIKEMAESGEECDKLSIQQGNVKVPHLNFNLSAGASCPFARVCKAYVTQDPETGKRKIVDAQNLEPDEEPVRCYAASDERYPSVHETRKINFQILKGKSKDEMFKLLMDAMERYDVDDVSKYFRIHVSGDFFNQDYFDAWLDVARTIDDTVFYAFTKSIPYWIARKDQIPPNFRLTASYGGTHDHLIDEHGLKRAVIVNSQEEADEMGLPVATTDKFAYKKQHADQSFAIIVHGSQPKGTERAKAAYAQARKKKDV